MRYEYLIGTLSIGIIWAILFILRRDLRRPMLWSGAAYIAIISTIYLTWLLTSPFIFWGSPLVPDYWDPTALFNLGRITRGYAIEDALFAFFAGGIAAALYETFFRQRIRFKRKYRHHIRAPLVGFVAAGAFAAFFKLNAIYPFIVFGLAGAASIWLERKDLIRHSILGGVTFLIVYFLSFLIFNAIFPYFVGRYYNLENISGILAFGVPLEELLYAISVGFLWGPLYEYEHGEKDIDL